MNLFDYLFERTGNLEKKLVLGDAETATYREIHGKILKVASYLGRWKKQNIGLVADNSIFFIIAYFAMIKSGNVAVPVSPKVSRSEFGKIADTCSMDVVFSAEKYRALAGPAMTEIITEENYLMLPDADGPSGAWPETSDEDLAALIFTSGSTGEPKGVIQTHGNIIANTESIIKYLGITEKDVQLVVLPFSYCFGASLLHTHIRQGGSLVLNNTFALTRTVLDDLVNYGCTSFSGVPSHYQILLRKSRFKEMRFPDLRYISQAGGKLTNPYILEIRRAHPEIPLIVMYGQTEATARLSYLPFEMLDSKLGSIGTGIPGVKLKVVDADGNDVKPGETGEIVAQGRNITKGYYKDPEGTSKILRGGVLHTGDLATVDEDGYIYIRSREKHIIKSAGNRVSPKEIESAIMELPGVVDCVVIGVPDDLLGEVPKAVVLVAEGAALTRKSVLAHCRSRLTTFKVPKYVEFVAELPFTHAGKIDTTKVVALHGNRPDD